MRARGILLLPLFLVACESEDLLAGLPDAAPQIDAGCMAGYPIYLNRYPVTIQPGVVNDSVANTSTMLTEPATTTGSQFSHADWSAAIACARELFAPFPIVITDEDPGDVDHLEIVVTHLPGELGFDGNIRSIAALPCGGAIRRSVAFAFSGTFSSPRDLCEGGFGYPAGVAAGLTPSVRCEDVMNWNLDSCASKSFLDEEVQCGVFSPMTCQCGGDTQNSYQQMMQVYGSLCR
jgi:hypothetical protein